MHATQNEETFLYYIRMYSDSDTSMCLCVLLLLYVAIKMLKFI